MAWGLHEYRSKPAPRRRLQHRVYEESEWDWARLCQEHSLGWVTARIDGRLVGFVNVLWDGLVHAWAQDEMVSPDTRHQGIASVEIPVPLPISTANSTGDSIPVILRMMSATSCE